MDDASPSQDSPLALPLEVPTEVREASQPFVGRWNQLVSTTNWEKGHIICQWRDSLQESGAPITSYSDEAWSQLVGAVSGQHAGRLRRVYQRFGAVAEQYAGLYWSHFQAALDWDDAEMWLEGALQSKWSVARMRSQRWEALSAPDDLKPREEDIVQVELDEDFESAGREPPLSPEMTSPHDVPFDEDGAGESAPEASRRAAREEANDSGIGERVETVAEFEQVRPFENLADLPEDLAAAFESYKLAILRHKSSEWEAISLDEVLGSLDALKQLARAPA